MRVLITIKGGCTSIEGEAPAATLEALVDVLKASEFIILDKTPYGKVIVNKSAIGYITRKQ